VRQHVLGAHEEKAGGRYDTDTQACNENGHAIKGTAVTVHKAAFHLSPARWRSILLSRGSRKGYSFSILKV
jgi:hypothetical protein